MDGSQPFQPAGPGFDHLQIEAPGRARVVKPVPSQSFTIGRDKKNIVPIEDEHASRQHVRIDFDGVNYKITDLKSRNRTFLDNSALLPGQPQVWHPDKELRVGDHRFRLVSDQTATKIPEQKKPLEPPVAPPQTAIAKAQTKADNVQLEVSPTEITTTPGLPTTLQVTVTNLSEKVVHYTLRLAEVPPEWVKVSPKAAVELNPKGSTTVTILVQPVASIKTKAGRFRFYVEAQSRSKADQVLKVKGALIIGAFGDFKSELRQNKAVVGAPLRILVKNNSNQPNQFTLSCWDEANELHFSIPKKSVETPAGGNITLDFTAQLRRRRWIGGLKPHTFQAKISALGGKEEIHRGTFESRGLIPPWLPPLLVIVLVAVAGLANMMYTNHQNRIATQTAVAIAATGTAVAQLNATATAAVVTATATAEALAATQTAQANATATQAAAETATAVWLAEDSDKDGLINQRELELNTLPNSDDTDGDGLRDGDEVNRYRTDPLDDDSDGDGLKDGAEVERGSNPLNRDTDGDNDPDNTDPDAIRLPTPTPNLAATAAVVAQMTAEFRTEEAIKTAAQDAKEGNATATQEAKDATATAEKRMQETEVARQQADKDARATAEAAATATTAAQQTAAAIPVPTPTPRLIGMNLHLYCQNHGYANAVVDGATVYSWRCAQADGTMSEYLADIHYDALCREQHGAGSASMFTDYNDFKSWACIVP